MGERSIEVKVGALILVSLAILVAFVLILGRVTTREGFRINVLFVHPGGLSPGAPVKIAGGEVGRVEEMTYLGSEGPLRPAPAGSNAAPQRTRVKVRIWVEERVRQSIREDASYYVTMEGILAEPFLEVDPGVEGPAVVNDATVFGVDPPRLDQALANGAASLETINKVLSRNEQEIDQLIGGLARTVKTVDELLTRNQGEVDDLITHADELLVETRDTVKQARALYVDNPRISRTLANLDSTTTLLARHDDELIANLDRTLDRASDALETVGPEQREQIRGALAKISRVMTAVDTSMTDVQAIVARVRRGEGTVGALLMDEEVYDDLKELLRDLKHNPWKFFWRE